MLILVVHPEWAEWTTKVFHYNAKGPRLRRGPFFYYMPNPAFSRNPAVSRNQAFFRNPGLLPSRK